MPSTPQPPRFESVTATSVTAIMPALPSGATYLLLQIKIGATYTDIQGSASYGGERISVQSLQPDTSYTFRIKAVGEGNTNDVYSYSTAATVTTLSINPPPGDPVPTLTLGVNPSSIAAGQSATLTWSATNATKVTLGGLGDKPPAGSLTVAPDMSTVYTATATGPGGQVTKTVTLVVTAGNGNQHQNQPPVTTPTGCDYGQGSITLCVGDFFAGKAISSCCLVPLVAVAVIGLIVTYELIFAD